MRPQPPIDRRSFLAASAALLSSSLITPARAFAALDQTKAFRPGATKTMQWGLVTYMWGADWDLPTLIANCEKAKTLGVELRTTHRHAVETTLNKTQRAEVKKRFADSPVTLVGIGSNERFDNPDPAALKRAVEATRQFIILNQDVGGTGVKVKPDSFHKNVPREKTIEQIGKTLNQLGAFAQDHGSELRLEIHGQCAEIPIIKKIIDIADHPAVCLCWNSNAQDLKGKGLEANFNMVKDRFGSTLHVRPLDSKSYPFPRLIALLAKMDYRGWVMLEATGGPADKVPALAQQSELFDKLVAEARKRAAAASRPTIEV